MKKERILIIDSTGGQADEIRRLVSEKGYTVCGAVTEIAQALETAADLLPAVVLLDTSVKMAAEGGIDTADQIQARLHIPVVFLVSRIEGSAVEKLKAALPFGCLLKPVNGDELDITIEMAVYRNQRELKFAENTQDLHNRINELNCLYGISSLRENPELSLEQILQGIVDLLPRTCQYSEHASARIILENQEYVSALFQETDVNQSSPIKVNGKNLGRVEIHGRAPLSLQDRCIQEGKNLLSAVAERLGRIIERKSADEALHAALIESQRRQTENSALLKSASAVLEYREFKDAVRIIYDSCKNLIGASAGYVALLSKDGIENELLFLDAGNQPCSVDPDLPMPIRGLRAEAYHTGKVVHHNDFSNSDWARFMPKGHMALENVLFAPMVIGERVLGLLGIANKPGGFADDDLRIASAFGELAAIALRNSRTLESLEISEKQIRSVVETARDGIVTINDAGNIVFWNKGAEDLFGYTEDQIVGKPVTKIMPERFRQSHNKGMVRFNTSSELDPARNQLELTGLRKDGSEFPIELSLASWQANEGMFFTGIIRDITERKAVENSLLVAQNELENRVKERTAELSTANRELQRLSEKLLNAHEEESKRIGQELHDGLAQSISAIKVWTESALIQLRQKKSLPEITSSLESVVDLTKRAVEDVRRISRNLRPSVLDDLGILATISWLCQEFESVYAHINIEKRLDIRENDVPDTLKIVIFRIMQEALNNAAKHSRASLLQISLLKKNGNIKLQIHDNGRGFNVKDIFTVEKPGKGLGLASMKERSKLSGGIFSIKSGPDSGTTVYVTWPDDPSPGISNQRHQLNN